MAEQRTKEIGIRKVLGAGISRILVTLSGSYLKWVLLANIIACPVSYYFMGRWLEGYAYHTRLSPWIFIVSALASLFIAFFTIGYQTLRAASKDPVKAIKYE
jgi:putative ABC transport system permease protein